jgi:hypothetical protein
MGYIEEQLAKRKKANVALSDFKFDSAMKITKAAASIVATSAMAAGSAGGASPFAVIAIIRGGLTIVNECVKQFTSQAQMAEIVIGQLDDVYLQLGTTRDKLNEEVGRAKFEGEEVEKSQRAGVATLVGNTLTDFFKTEWATGTIKNVRTMTDAHGHKITALKNNYSHLVDVQKAFERYKAKWAQGDVLAYLNSLPKDEWEKLVRSGKWTEATLRNRLQANIADALAAQERHMKRMQALFDSIKAANQLQKGFEKDVSALEAKNPEWAPVAAALLSTAVDAGLGAGEIMHAEEEPDKKFGIAMTVIELSEGVNELKKEVKETEAYKAAAEEAKKLNKEMTQAFEKLRAKAAKLASAR